MSAEAWAAIGSVISTVIAGIVAYLKFRRSSGGEIRTTTAERLWDQMEVIRSAMAQQLAEAAENAEHRILEIAELESKLYIEREGHKQCQGKLVEYKARISELEKML
jgi:tRNA A37 N6-isopentenylltransferase MiaA